MSGHPVTTFHRGLTRRPPSFYVVRMDAGDRMHEVSRMVHCLVLVPGSNEPVVRCPFIAPYSAAGYDVPLNNGDQGGAVTLGDQLHEEVASGQVHGAEHPLRRDRPRAGVRRRLRLCNHSFVHGHDPSWPSQLNWVVEQIP